MISLYLVYQIISRQHVSVVIRLMESAVVGKSAASVNVPMYSSIVISYLDPVPINILTRLRVLLWMLC